MKAISVLGTSSNAGTSWIATALCAWLRKQGVRVAPFKAQNMSNNAYATLEGGEIGVSQAVQAEACGLRPTPAMNPILLKPTGDSRSQLVRLGKAGPHIPAQDYYKTLDESWTVVRQTLDEWTNHCDVLVMEGAGSPVELNLMERDIANLKPGRYAKGKWILVADIERGGVFAQVIGTWNLLPAEDRANGLGFIVNKFRGDPMLFASAERHFRRHTELPYLGVLPLRSDLRIDDEDSLVSTSSNTPLDTPYFAWIRFPRLSNSQDQLPWLNDSGIHQIWTTDPASLDGAAAIILPGSKDTLADLDWLRQTGLADKIIEKSRQGTSIVGICGGYQMLGRRIDDPHGKAGTSATRTGLDLLPIETEYADAKTVTRRTARYEDYHWESYEIRMGRTRILVNDANPLIYIEDATGQLAPEGVHFNNIWGTYQHGLFDHFCMRDRLLRESGLGSIRASPSDWAQYRRATYDQMADFIDNNLNLNTLRNYLGL